MKTRLFALLVAAALLAGLTACRSGEGEADAAVRVAATTYPVYLFTTAVTEGVDGVEVELMVNQQTSCLHDYTLTIRDMKIVDRADVIVMNGAGLEDFLSDVLDQCTVPVIDCSAGVELLPAQEHEGHEHGDHGHETEYDPHIWMDPARASEMVGNISDGLSELDPENGPAYRENADRTQALLKDRKAELLEMGFTDTPGQHFYNGLITFHDGFRYYADAFDLTILKSVEEEEGAEASAADIRDILNLIEEHRLPAIFTETNGSDATALAIARETGCKVCTLDMLMSGEGSGIEPYLEMLDANRGAIMEGLT